MNFQVMFNFYLTTSNIKRPPPAFKDRFQSRLYKSTKVWRPMRRILIYKCLYKACGCMLYTLLCRPKQENPKCKELILIQITKFKCFSFCMIFDEHLQKGAIIFYTRLCFILYGIQKMLFRVFLHCTAVRQYCSTVVQ